MRRPQLVLLALVVAGASLGLQWSAPRIPDGRLFLPRPDGREYAAGAQAIVQSGEYFLQVGPLRARPRYAPGWSLLLAGPLRLGLPATELWRVASLFSAAVAATLALISATAAAAFVAARAGSAASATASPAVDAARRAGWIAGLVAGGAWTLIPTSFHTGQSMLSDQPAVFLSLAAAALGAIGAWRGSVAVALLGGLAFGTLATVRPVAAALLCPALLALLAGAVHERGGRAVVRPALGFAAGVVPPVLLTCLLLVRSGYDPLPWSAYELWVPARYGSFARTFPLRFALTPNADFPAGARQVPLSHLDFSLRALLGLPGLYRPHASGWAWPALGWAAAMGLVVLVRRRGGTAARRVSWVAVAGLATVAGHVALTLAYFAPVGRFYLLPLGTALAALSVAAGAALVSRRSPVRLAGLLAVAVILLGTVPATAPLRRAAPAAASRFEQDCPARLTRWRALTDEQRGRDVMPCDPVYAQALGLLPPDRVAGIVKWGRLPPTTHVKRLRARRLLDRADIAREFAAPPHPSHPRRVRP